jgi:protein SCO1
VTAGRRLLAVAVAIGVALSLTPPAASDARVAIRLTTQHGAAFTERDLDAVPVAMFFGFTNCPDVCPTTLLQVTQDLEELGADGDKIKVVFVSVDPERDTPARLAEYMASFDPRIVALTGAQDVIAAVARAYGASYRRVPTGDTYTIDHTGAVFLLDREGEYVGALTHADSRPSRQEKLRRLLQ